MPATLQMLASMKFSRGHLSQREAISRAIAKTDALWEARDSSASWEQRYNRQLGTNTKLALAAFSELFTISVSPYADALRIEKQMRQQLDAAVQDAARLGTNSAKLRHVEDSLRRPIAAIRESAASISAIDTAISPLRDIIVTTNLRLVAHSVGKFRIGKFSDPRSFDYFQEGVMGLLEALDRYDPSHNTNFTTYATWWIQRRLLTCASEEDLIAIPDGVRSLMRRERTALERLTQTLGTSPTPEEIVATFKTSTFERKNINDARRTVLEEVIREGDSSFRLLEQQTTHDDSPSSISQHSEQMAQLISVMPRLFEGQILFVMRQTYLKTDEPNQPEITDADLRATLGVTSSRLNQIRRRGILELADYFILTSFSAAKRQPIFDRVLTGSEQALVKNLLSSSYKPTETKKDQQLAILKSAHALLLTTLGETTWPVLAEKAGLTPRQTFVVHHRIFGGERTWRGTALETIAAGLAPEMQFGELDAHRMFVMGIKHLAPNLRALWQNKEANRSTNPSRTTQTKGSKTP